MSKLSVITLAAFSVMAQQASAQYYNPTSNHAPHYHQHQPGGAGLDLGLRNNAFNPNVGFGISQVGAGVGAGIGAHGIGTGANVGVGPLGVSTDGGISRNGLGLRAASGIGNTGAAFEGGLTNGGLGLGANAKILGFGPGASVGIGKRGPGIGASLAFGRIGTLLIGSHRNTYPGAQQTASHMVPGQDAAYYTPQNYGNSSYYRTQPTEYQNHIQPRLVHRTQYPSYTQSAPTCSANWTC